MQANIDNEKEQRELDNVINEVKKQLQRMFTEKKTLIKKLGEAYEKVVSNQESICEEIKNELKNEIAEGLISNRLIERYCPANWKKKRRPKKEDENDNLSLWNRVKSEMPPIIIENSGRAIPKMEQQDIELNNHPEEKMSLTNEIPKKQSSYSLSEYDKNDLLNFEIPFSHSELKDYVTRQFALAGDPEGIWISGVINKVTGKVLKVYFDRLPKSIDELKDEKE